MDKPMNEYAADAPRVLRDFLTYISTIRGKSAKTAHEYYLDLRLFFRVLKHNKGAVDKNLPLDEIDISDIDLDFIRNITLSDTYDYLEYMAQSRPTQQPHQLRIECQLACTQGLCDTRVFSVFNR